MTERVLIVGAGQAGMQIAVSLRDGGFEGSITLVGEEPHGPYQRPPLSKAYLAGTADEESLELRTPEFYVAQRIVVIPGERVVRLFWGPEHGVAVTDTGRELAFDKLALTTGAGARRLDLPGNHLAGVLTMRDLADAKALKSHWDAVENVVVIGGGFIGLEVAAVARTYDKRVTVLHSSERLMRRAVGPDTSAFFRAAHERRGAELRFNVSVAQLVGAHGRVTGVELADGEIVPADVVVVGVGAVPRADLAKQLGLDLHRGAILVDSAARTSDARVVAAGDAVVFPHPLGGEGLVQLESVQNAVDQAKVAAKTLLGEPAEYRAVPWFWSDQADLKLQMAGLSAGYDQTVLRGDPEAEKFSVLYYRAGRLIAVDAVNDVSDYMAVRRALGAGLTIPAEAAADSAVALKTLITD